MAKLWKIVTRTVTQSVLFLLCMAGMMQTAYSEPNSMNDLVNLFDYDRSISLDIQENSVRLEDGFKVYDITYASPKGGRVTAYLVVPEGKGPYAGIVFGHWGYGTRTEFLPEAMLYAQAGAVSLLIDYPWVRPAPWRRSTDNLTQPETDRDIFIQAVIDLRRGIDLLLLRSDIDPKRIAYVGHSYGAQWGAIISAVDKRIRAAVLMGGVGRIADIFLGSDDPDFVNLRAQRPKEEIERYVDVIGTLDGINFVPHATPVLLLFQFARYERYFAQDSMEKYALAASDPKLVKWYDTGHDLNDIQALADRAAWLQDKIRIRSVASILRKKLK